MRAPQPPEPQVELEDILQTTLAFGVRVQVSGGYTARVKESMERLAEDLGADSAHSWVTDQDIGLTVGLAGTSHTAVTTTPPVGVNFTELSDLAQLSKASPGLTPTQVREELTGITATARRYPKPVTIAMLGVACGSFAGIFGADAAGMAIAAAAGAAGAFLRNWLMSKHFKPFIYCVFSAFLSVSIVLGLHRLTGFAATVDQAAVASILYLVPGVPMLNGTADLLTSNYLNGVARLTRAAVILLGTSVGFTTGFLLWGAA